MGNLRERDFLALYSLTPQPDSSTLPEQSQPSFLQLVEAVGVSSLHPVALVYRSGEDGVGMITQCAA